MFYKNWKHRIRESMFNMRQDGSWVHPTSHATGTAGFPKGAKQSGREADNSLLSSADVKNVWSCASTSSYILIALCSDNHKDHFTFDMLKYSVFNPWHALMSVIIHVLHQHYPRKWNGHGSIILWQTKLSDLSLLWTFQRETLRRMLHSVLNSTIRQRRFGQH
jgi:hypothetical protein